MESVESYTGYFEIDGVFSGEPVGPLDEIV